MTETSRPWGGTTVGDATLAPYTADAWTDMWRKLFLTDRTTQGVIKGYGNELAVTGSASPVAVNTGAAVVDGNFYENDASLNVAIPTPAGSTRIDRIVLRKGFSAQTVRITRIAGVEGGGAPAVVQIDGTTWDVPLYQVSITTGGVITLTNERTFGLTPLATSLDTRIINDKTPVSHATTTLTMVKNIAVSGILNSDLLKFSVVFGADANIGMKVSVRVLISGVEHILYENLVLGNPGAGRSSVDIVEGTIFSGLSGGLANELRAYGHIFDKDGPTPPLHWIFSADMVAATLSGLTAFRVYIANNAAGTVWVNRVFVEAFS